MMRPTKAATKSRYDDADRILQYLVRRFIEMYGAYQSNVLAMDELNILKTTKTLYDDLLREVEMYFRKLARLAYGKAEKEIRKYTTNGKVNTTKVEAKWLRHILSDHNPVTKYVFMNEKDRQRDRLIEAILAGAIVMDATKSSLKHWTDMVKQYAIEVVDEATVTALRDYGVEKVMWMTERDERVCDDCEPLDGKIFRLEELPEKPHIRCRCWIVPYEED